MVEEVVEQLEQLLLHRANFNFSLPPAQILLMKAALGVEKKSCLQAWVAGVALPGVPSLQGYTQASVSSLTPLEKAKVAHTLMSFAPGALSGGGGAGGGALPE